jgi:integrase
MLSAESRERALFNRNVAGTATWWRAQSRAAPKRGKSKIGVDIPTPDEIRAIVAALAGRPTCRALASVAPHRDLLRDESAGASRPALAGDRLRNCMCVNAPIAYHVIGRPQSKGGERIAPIPLPVLSALRQWKPKPPGASSTSHSQSALPAPLCTSVWDMLHHHHHQMTMDVDGHLFYRILDGAALQ